MRDDKMSDEQINKALEAIEIARASGKIKKGVNEVTKALEKGNAKLVAAAGNVNPKEIIMHLPLLSKEKEVPYFEISSKDQLGAAAGLSVGTSAVAIVDEGKAKDLVAQIAKESKESTKE